MTEGVDGGHRFSVFDVSAEGDDLADELASQVRSLYVDPELLIATLRDAAADIGAVLDTRAVAAIVDEMATAAVPEPGTRRTQPHLDTARSDLAEVIAYSAAEQIYAVAVPAKRIREKEVPYQPSRGLDLIGIRARPEFSLVIGEVKASEQAESPPGVVGDGDTSLRGQFLAIRDRMRVRRELGWAIKHSAGEGRRLLGRALLLHAKFELPITLMPVLVRPAQHHGGQDFGCFRDNPDEFSPAPIIFCIVRIEDSLDGLADAVYTRARGAA